MGVGDGGGGVDAVHEMDGIEGGAGLGGEADGGAGGDDGGMEGVAEGRGLGQAGGERRRDRQRGQLRRRGFCRQEAMIAKDAKGRNG